MSSETKLKSPLLPDRLHLGQVFGVLEKHVGIDDLFRLNPLVSLLSRTFS